MSKVKYGKIKSSFNSSNIFGTTIQLIIRMKQLIDDQYDFLKKYPNSEIIPAIIDIYEQFNIKKEYLNIDSFVHFMKKEIQYKDDINFIEFFSSALCSTDLSNTTELISFKNPLAFTSLKNKINEKTSSSYFFDILLKDNKKLSTIIEDTYEFSFEVFKKPEFLFFHPINSANASTIFDEKIFFGKYNLSVIVVKKIAKGFINHFVLYIGLYSWIRIEDEEIIVININDIFEEISKQEIYQIELLGFCSDPDRHINPMYSDGPVAFKYYDIDVINQIQTTNESISFYQKQTANNKTSIDQKQTANNKTSINQKQTTNESISFYQKQTANKNISNYLNQATKQQISIYNKNEKSTYRVNYIEFNYSDYSYHFVSSKEFGSSDERDIYLKELDNIKDKQNTFMYYSNEYFGYINCFDSNENNVTVFSVNQNKKHLLQKPIEFFFVPYGNEKEDAKINLFHPNLTMDELFDYCFNNLPGKPTNLFAKYENTNKKLTRSKVAIGNNFFTNTITIMYSSDNDSFTNISASGKQSQNANNQRQQQSDIITSQIKRPSSSSSNILGNQKSQLNPSNNQDTEDKLVILRCLKSYAYDDPKNHFIKKITVKNISAMTGFVKGLLSKLKLVTSQKSEVLVYSIDKEGYVVKFYDIEKIIIKTLPSLVRVQIKPIGDDDCRVVILRKNTNWHSVENDQLIFSFIVPFDDNYNIFLERILNYLYHNKTERKFFNMSDYKPKLYIISASKFVEAVDLKIIINDPLKPIFVIWKSPNVYDEIINLIQSNIQEDTINLTQ